MTGNTSDKRYSAAQVQELAEYLQGTSLALYTAVYTLFGVNADPDDADLARDLAEHVFECVNCGWWYPVDEMGEDGVCIECENEEGGDDDE